MIIEELKHSDYRVRRKRQSKIDPSNTITDVSMKCPSCKTEQEDAPHGEVVACVNPRCHLYMRRLGNKLQCLEVDSLEVAKQYLLEE